MDKCVVRRTAKKVPVASVLLTKVYKRPGPVEKNFVKYSYKCLVYNIINIKKKTVRSRKGYKIDFYF